MSSKIFHPSIFRCKLAVSFREGTCHFFHTKIHQLPMLQAAPERCCWMVDWLVTSWRSKQRGSLRHCGTYRNERVLPKIRSFLLWCVFIVFFFFEFWPIVGVPYNGSWGTIQKNMCKARICHWTSFKFFRRLAALAPWIPYSTSSLITFSWMTTSANPFYSTGFCNECPLYPKKHSSQRLGFTQQKGWNISLSTKKICWVTPFWWPLTKKDLEDLSYASDLSNPS